MNNLKRTIAIIGCFLLCVPFIALAQTDEGYRDIEALVTRVKQEVVVEGQTQMIFEAESELGERFTVDTSESYLEGLRYHIEAGDKVLLQVIDHEDGTQQVFLKDIVRSWSLLWIFLIFAIITVVIGHLRGLAALGGMLVTVGILFSFVFPAILAGQDPVLMTILGGIGILFVNMHLAHGISRKTFMAFLSTVIGLFIVYGLSSLFIHLANLSGLATEESVLLYWSAEAVTLPKGILLASIILGAVGVLDDIAMTQTEVVYQLKAVGSKMTQKKLMKHAMKVGRHHIASTVNTLVLVYAAAAMPLLLLFLHTSLSTSAFINEEVVAEEIIRTLCGTIGLVLTVPISTWFAIKVAGDKSVDHKKKTS